MSDDDAIEGRSLRREMREGTHLEMTGNDPIQQTM